jgi:hypothetical protein
MGFNLFYLATPVYGGWVSFTAHLSLKHDLKLYKIGTKTEEKTRPYGYGVDYQNIAPETVESLGTHIITAIDKHFYDTLHLFPDGTFIVIHDPTEVTKKQAQPLLEHLHRFRIITIRASVKEFLATRLRLSSMFLLHPFHTYPFHKDPHPSKAISMSRIDFDKHTDIILNANALLPESKAIDVYGAMNRQYVYFKLQQYNFKKYYKGKFDKTFEAMSNLLEDVKYCIDMSVIQFDGGGTQYTFLEAIYQQCALVINKQWVEGYSTPFVHGKNCYVVENGEELAALIQSNSPVQSLLTKARAILEPHIKVDWVQKLQSYPSIPKRTMIRSATRKRRSQKD